MLEGCIIAPVSTLIGILIFIGCICAFGPFGLISLVFVIPFIKGCIMRARLDEAIDEAKRKKDN